MTADPGCADPCLGGLDEEVRAAIRIATDPRVTQADAQAAVIYARAISHSVYVLTGVSLTAPATILEPPR